MIRIKSTYPSSFRFSLVTFSFFFLLSSFLVWADCPKWIGRFDIMREIGGGGYATVYEARDLRTQKRVALKVMHRSRALLETLVGIATFVNEVRMVSRFSHPNIIKPLGVGSSNGYLWMAMPLMSGTLEDMRFGTQGFDLKKVLRMVLQVALALQAVHQKGITHRDVKPENVLVSSDGTAVLADFAAARWDHFDMLEPITGVTGTDGFIAPEFLFSPNQVVSGTSLDLFSLGVTLYSTLSGGNKPYPDLNLNISETRGGETRGVGRPHGSDGVFRGAKNGILWILFLPGVRWIMYYVIAPVLPHIVKGLMEPSVPGTHGVGQVLSSEPQRQFWEGRYTQLTSHKRTYPQRLVTLVHRLIDRNPTNRPPLFIVIQELEAILAEQR